MKKLFLAAAVLLLATGLSAQKKEKADRNYGDPFLNKRGIEILPKQGDFAIGIEANPFLEYLGNMFTKNGSNNAPTFNGKDFGIYGKYFLRDNRAIRARLSINMYSDKSKSLVEDDINIGDDPSARVEDMLKLNTNEVNLFVGYEFRRGRGRIQGFWGGEAMLGVESRKSKYEWGNEITSTNQNPTTGYNAQPSGEGTRLLEDKYGTRFAIGVGGFAGVEYFFAPLMSLGGEFNLHAGFQTRGKGKEKSEGWDTTEDIYRKYTLNTRNRYPVRSGIQTNAAGRIFVMFHF